jgi:hypothetical protein
MPLKKSSASLSKKELASKEVQSKKRNTAFPKTRPVKLKTEKENASLPDHKLKTVQPSGRREESFFLMVYVVYPHYAEGRVTAFWAICAGRGTKNS